MNKMLSLFLTVVLICVLTACSSGSDSKGSSSSSSKSSADTGIVSKNMVQDSAMKETAKNQKAPDKGKVDAPDPQNDRMVIYHANMDISVKDFSKAEKKIRSLIKMNDGYIVKSTTTNSDESDNGGRIEARIPQPKFNTFLDQIEKVASKVKERSIGGDDVTKQYVDLQSRLKAKQTVEKRLSSFLKGAKDTKDLLSISDSLANVQEEIEQLKGQMNYLKNHSDLSTVTVTLTEKSTELTKQKDLDTWGKTKRAFINSLNALVAFFSGIVIFLLGFSPILIPLLIIAAAIYFFVKRKNKE